MLSYLAGPRPIIAPRPAAPRPRGGTIVVNHVTVVHHWYSPIYTPFHYYMPLPYVGHVSILGVVLVLAVLVFCLWLVRD